MSKWRMARGVPMGRETVAAGPAFVGGAPWRSSASGATLLRRLPRRHPGGGDAWAWTQRTSELRQRDAAARAPSSSWPEWCWLGLAAAGFFTGHSKSRRSCSNRTVSAPSSTPPSFTGRTPGASRPLWTGSRLWRPSTLPPSPRTAGGAPTTTRATAARRASGRGGATGCRGVPALTRTSRCNFPRPSRRRGRFQVKRWLGPRPAVLRCAAPSPFGEQPMRLHRSSILAAALLCGVFTACQTGPSTNLVAAWQLPGYVPSGFKRVLVICVTRDGGRRRTFEDAFSYQLIGRGVTGHLELHPHSAGWPGAQRQAGSGH